MTKRADPKMGTVTIGKVSEKMPKISKKPVLEKRLNRPIWTSFILQRFYSIVVMTLIIKTPSKILNIMNYSIEPEALPLPEKVA